MCYFYSSDGHSVEIIRKREIKWLDMLDDWDKWMSKKPKKVGNNQEKYCPIFIRQRFLCY